ncbi:MAG: hypothetical protein ACTSVZ_13700 [Promethearchaeota archaeon]
MTLLDDILTYLAPITPYVEWLLLFLIPLYISIGEIFANIALTFIQFLPTDSFIVSYVILGVFVVLGIVGGIMSEKKSKEGKDAGLTHNSYDDDLPDPGTGQSTYFGAK